MRKNCKTIVKLVGSAASVEYISKVVTKTSTENELYMSWKSRFQEYFPLDMTVEGFPKHQNMLSDFDRYKLCFCIACVS